MGDPRQPHIFRRIEVVQLLTVLARLCLDVDAGRRAAERKFAPFLGDGFRHRNVDMVQRAEACDGEDGVDCVERVALQVLGEKDTHMKPSPPPPLQVPGIEAVLESPISRRRGIR